MRSVSAHILCGLLVILLLIPLSPSSAQILYKWEREELQKLGIDPNNKQMVLDSLRSQDSRVRFLAINFCGREKIREALPIFKELFRQYGARSPFSLSRYIDDRSQILEAVIDMEDTTFHEQFKMEIDSLRATGEGRDVDYTIKFSSYLAKKHYDEYGYAAMYAYYSRIEEYVPRLIIVSVSYLEPFLTPQHRDELLPLLRTMAVVHPRDRGGSLSLLQKLQDPQLESLAMQIARSDSDASVRDKARRVLRDLKSPLYVTALIEASRNETRYRSMNYELLIETHQPSAYKYVWDVLKQNSDPESNEVIKIYLDNRYLFYPPKDIPTAVLFDSLVTAVPQISSYGWLGDADFVNELGNDIQLARSYVVSGDSLNCARVVGSFYTKVDQEYRDSLDDDTRAVSVEGWKFLCYSAEYILDRLPKLAPVLNRLSPTIAQPGGAAFELTVFGDHFTDRPTVRWNGSERSTYFASRTELQAWIPAPDIATPGTATVTVVNPDGQTSSSLVFTIGFPPQEHILAVPSQYATIQAAVNASHPSDVIEVSPGTYRELVSINNKDSLTLRTTGGVDQVTVRGFRLQQSNVITIRGFIVDATGTTEHGIVLLGGNNQNTDVTIEACEIKNAGNDQSGISIARGNPRTRIVNNRIHDNGRNGILIIDATGGPHYVINNTIVRNGWNGVNVARQHVITLVNNILSFNGTKSGSTGGRYGVLREAMTGPGEASGIMLLSNLIVGNNGSITSTSSRDLGNFAQTLDASDSGNYTTAGTEGSGVTAAPVLTMTDVFVSATDLHLKSASFAINRGLSSYAAPDAKAGAIPAVDYEGEGRPKGSAVDVGADERE